MFNNFLERQHTHRQKRDSELKELINDKLIRESEEISKATFTPKINDFKQKDKGSGYDNFKKDKNKSYDIKSKNKEINGKENNVKDLKLKTSNDIGPVKNQNVNEKLNFTFND